jgi:hypothetical protein
MVSVHVRSSWPGGGQARSPKKLALVRRKFTDRERSRPELVFMPLRTLRIASPRVMVSLSSGQSSAWDWKVPLWARMESPCFRNQIIPLDFFDTMDCRIAELNAILRIKISS